MQAFRRLFGSLILIFIIGLVSGLFVTVHVSAHNNGWLWVSKSSSKVENRTSGYGTYISGARSAYDATNLTVASGTGGNLIHVDTTQSGVSWWGGTVAYSAGTACDSFPGLTSTGYCNNSTHKTDFTYIYWNSYNIPAGASATYLNTLARHEMGHSYGLGHIDESGCENTISSVMQKFVNCSMAIGTLSSHDVGDINGLYP